MQIETRLEKVRKHFAGKQIEALLISQPENLFYLTGCEGLEGYVLIDQKKMIIITDFRYIEQVQRQIPDVEIFQIKGKMADWFPALFSNLNIRYLGFESHHLNYALFEQINSIIKKSALNLNLVPVEGLVESIRVIKDATEIACISMAAEITGAAFAFVEKILQPGITEKALAWEIEKFMREKGSQPVPFELIVAAGPNSAMPHARPTEKIICAGEPVVIDIGSKYGNYVSDMTRTFFIGESDDTFHKIYHTVLEAQLTAIAHIKTGMTGQEADAIARRIIATAGYSEAFGHSLGHGIGLVTHENPRVGPGSTDLLEEGMVFTVEPGIYLPGWGGVRIEDDITLVNGKVKVISSARK